MWLLLKIEKAFGGLGLPSAFEGLGGGREHLEALAICTCMGVRIVIKK